MRIKKIYLITYFGSILLILFSFNIGQQKENIVTGRVFPAGMETPMRDVRVHIDGVDSVFTITDNSGSFSIEVDSFPTVLVFSKETYQTETKKVKKPTDISVYMLAGKNSK